MPMKAWDSWVCMMEISQEDHPDWPKTSRIQIGTWLDDSPRDEGYQQSNWTLKLVNHHVLQEFGERFSLSRIWEIVHGQGFTLIRPRHKTIVPTQEEIAETNNKTFHYLEKARLGEVRLFYLDETLATPRVREDRHVVYSQLYVGTQGNPS